MTTLSFLEAQQQCQAAVIPIKDTEHIGLNQALDRICSENIIAPMNVPAFDNSAMDGFAFCAQDLKSHKQLQIVGSALAGHPYSSPTQPGQAIRITTGAKMPDRCDTVLPQELATVVDDNKLDMNATRISGGENRRCFGEDIKLGDIVITKGSRLGPAQLGLLASLGIAEVNVQRRLRVALFSTGDELRSVGQHLDNGCIYDSNRLVLQSMLSRFGAEIVDLGVLADNPVELQAALQKCAADVDVVITSGGVANGSADFTKQVMQELGEMTYMRIGMRPARQLAVGRWHTSAEQNTLVFALPGNPVAVMISFYFLVRPALQLLSSAQVSMPPLVNARATKPIPKKIGRNEFQRGICQVSEQGHLQVSITGDQGAGILSSMSSANCMVVLHPEQADIEVGDTVQLVLFEGLLF